MSLDETFTALSDGTRREIVKWLLKGPRRAGELAERFELAGPAMSRHLKILRTSGLVETTFDETDARARTYQLKPERFVELNEWVAGYEKLWSLQLEAFKAHAEKTRKKK